MIQKCVDVLLGLQWGDEGKGKIIDVTAKNYKVIARFQGGANAGHTLEFEGKKIVLHLIPSGIFCEEAINVLGNGMVIDPIAFKKEIEEVCNYLSLEDLKKRIYISDAAHIIFPVHKFMDGYNEVQKGDKKIGTTGRGIGPTYTDKVARTGLRVEHILKDSFLDDYIYLNKSHTEFASSENIDIDKEFVDAIEFMKQFTITDTSILLNAYINQGAKILVEGAQGTFLDIDHGSYPYVTSSNTTIGGVITGLGIPPQSINEVYGLFKAYATRVGEGPFPTELHDSMGELLRAKGNEFGATTGRPRRCGWLDLVMLKYACMINGVTKLVMSKADVLNTMDSICVCSSYADDNETPIYTTLEGWTCIQSKEFVDYVSYIENYLDNIPINMISTGPDRKDIIMR
ncbi:TPA: adenylosuccinate synthase [Patescibacteria group bacterium]|nr:adenylosuccinate synthase [Candidatus Gracilibacteria bacterium]